MVVAHIPFARLARARVLLASAELAALMFASPARPAPAACADNPTPTMTPMPMPTGMNGEKPMPTGMAPPGAKESDVTHAAAMSKGCMDPQLQKDQAATGAKP